MANAVVTSDTKKVKVVFNDMATLAGLNHSYFSKKYLAEVKCFADGYTEVVLDNKDVWNVSTDGNNNTLIVDSVDGVVPANESELCDLIAALMDY